jgi:hypothetical protein
MLPCCGVGGRPSPTSSSISVTILLSDQSWYSGQTLLHVGTDGDSCWGSPVMCGTAPPALHLHCLAVFIPCACACGFKICDTRSLCWCVSRMCECCMHRVCAGSAAGCGLRVWQYPTCAHAHLHGHSSRNLSWKPPCCPQPLVAQRYGVRCRLVGDVAAYCSNAYPGPFCRHLASCVYTHCNFSFVTHLQILALPLPVQHIDTS